MNTVGSLAEFLNQLAPLSLSEDWDNTGLLVGDLDQNVSNVMTCLTVTEDVVSEAVHAGVDMIVSHHPVLFRAAKKITTQSAEGRMLLKLIAGGIAVYSPHTAFDSSQLGINQRLADALDLQQIQCLRASTLDEHPGSGRWGCLVEGTSLSFFLGQIKKAVAADYVEYCGDLASDVNRVAVACGSAAEFLADAIAHGCDTFVTGEARFHSVLEAQSSNVNLILMGHYESERPAVEWLASEIQEQVSGVQVFASEADTNPLRIHH
ncbi:MAG: Nif3-like dinuclear metal center hexameric protein [Fuerstiella sp.]